MRYTLLCLSILLLSALGAQGKGTGTIKGKVTGEDGKGVSAVITFQAPKVAERKLSAAADGRFLVVVGVGTYTGIISAPSYESQRFTGINTEEGKTALLNVQLHKTGKWGSSMTSHVYVAQQPVAKNKRRVTGMRYLSKSGMGASRRPTAIRSVDVEEGRVYGAPAPTSAGDYDRMSPGAATFTETASGGSSAKRESSDDKMVSVTEGAIYVPSSARAHAGTLTSGEINDFSKWTLWEDISMEELKGYRAAWPFRPEARYSVIIKSKDGTPLCNAKVKMSNGGKTVWEAMTDNTGKAELWYGMWDAEGDAPSRLTASVDYGGKLFNINDLKTFKEGSNIINTQIACTRATKLDIAFIVDATGSMQDEINYLKEELRDILQKVKDSMPASQVQTAAIFYRDMEDTYVTRTSDLTSDFSKTEAFIADNNADGGGDFPESVDMALQEGLDGLHWRADASARLAFLVLDAPPHGDAATVKRMKDLTAAYAARGIRLIPVVCSGSDKSNEYLMRSLALATNGTYLFLTDHSGIGGSHTAPTTDKYDVEYLNGLIYRVIYQCSYMPECKTDASRPDSSVVHHPLSTDSLAKAIDWKYYPNPTTGILHLQHTGTKGEVYISDISGKAIMRFTADPSGTTTINVGQYPAGVYFIRYNIEGDQWVTGRFILTQ